MPVVVYSLLRLLLFVVVTAGLWWAGMQSWLAPLVAAFLAWGLSYVLLRGPRDAAVRHLAARDEARRARGGQGERAQADADAEDAEAARVQDGHGTDVPEPPPAPPAR